MPNRPELIASGVALRKPRRAPSVADIVSVDGPRSTMLPAFSMSPRRADLAGASASPLALSLPGRYLCVKRIILLRVITLRHEQTHPRSGLAARLRRGGGSALVHARSDSPEPHPIGDQLADQTIGRSSRADAAGSLDDAR